MAMTLTESAPLLKPVPPQSNVAEPAHNHDHKLIYGAAAFCILAGLLALLVSRYQRVANTPQFQLARVETGAIESRVSATGT